MRPAPLLATVAAAALIAGGCGSGDTGDAAGTTEASPPATAPAGDCRSVASPEPRPDGSETPPQEPLEAGTTYELRFSTSCGAFTVTLDQEAAPETTASLVALARSGFYDDTLFHRIVPGFVIQGGDPTQTGGGGPGYQTVDVPPADAAYTEGAVAMAKGVTEAPGTSGSQFFVVTAADAGLPPEYAIVGRVTSGLDVVETIGTLGDAFEEPTQPVVIERVTVVESG